MALSNTNIRNRTLALKDGFGIECPYCGGGRTERLEGLIVWECLDCGAAFNSDQEVS